MLNSALNKKFHRHTLAVKYNLMTTPSATWWVRVIPLNHMLLVDWALMHSLCRKGCRSKPLRHDVTIFKVNK